MGISIWQILLIVLVVVVLFGAGKLPRLMGDFAKGIKSFKTGMREGEAPPSATERGRNGRCSAGAQGDRERGRPDRGQRR